MVLVDSESYLKKENVGLQAENGKWMPPFPGAPMQRTESLWIDTGSGHRVQ